MSPPPDDARGARLAPAPKHPPHSMEAEQSVLGGLMLTTKHWEEVKALITADDFYTHDHRVIFYGIGDVLEDGAPLDFVTLSEKLRVQGNLEAAGGVAYLGTLANDTPSAANVVAYAKIIHERAVQRRLIAAGQDIAELGYQPGDRDPGELVNLAEQCVTKIQARRLARAKTMADVIAATTTGFEEARLRRAAGKSVGIPTGIRWLDKRIGGMRPGQLILLAARPSLGKTALLNQIALHAGFAGRPGLICSLEMSDEELGVRGLSVVAKVNLTRLSFGAEDEVAIAKQSVEQLSKLPLYFDTDTYDLHSLVSQITLHRRQYGIEWAAVDYIGLVEASGYRSTVDRISAISRAFKKLAKTLGIPILALSQLGHDVEKERRPPRLSDLRDSGSLEQDANTVIFIHSEAEDGAVPLPVQLHLAKNRGGRRGRSGDIFDFHGNIQTFQEHEPMPEAE